MAAPNGQPIVISTLSPLAFRTLTVITLTAGTAFLMWVGEQISERGIGNGISLLIFAIINASFIESDGAEIIFKINKVNNINLNDFNLFIV